MRILLINQFYPPDVAATGQLLADLACGLLGRIAREWRENYTLVVTGGGIETLLPYLPSGRVHDPDLTMRGIHLAWLGKQKNKPAAPGR